jgi:two-component system CheB/CheR fusion protein
VGRRIDEVDLPVLAPDLEAWIGRSMEKAVLVEAEVQDRSARWHRLQVRPHRAHDGKTDGAILSLVDIDALRHEVIGAQWARDYARSIVEAVQVPLVVLDAGLRVLSANAAYYGRFRQEPGQTEGCAFFELEAGGWATAELRQAVVGVGAGRGRFQGLELERELSGAGRIATSVSGCAVPVPNGKPMILLALEDVTERRHGERHRADLLAVTKTARARAERADAAKDVLLANLSHELRTPLTTVLLQAELLRGGRLDADAMQRAGVSIEANVKRQVKLVEDLLDAARSAGGKVVLEQAPVDWRALVAGVVEAAQGEAAAKPVSLELAPDGGRPFCLGDAGRLQQVVGNLVANAIKFTPGGGQVRLRVDAVDGVARLVVADSGCGMDTAFLPHVFERFAQEGPAGQGGGLGLGLAIVKELVALHGGSIQAESPGAGLGSTFTVTLPRQKAADALPA